MRLVVISDPLESGRQIHSDGGDFLRGVVSHHAHLGDVRLVSPTEDEVADELDALDPSETAAVIFETNSLRHRSEEHTSELQSRGHLVCRLLLEKKNGLLIAETELGQRFIVTVE